MFVGGVIVLLEGKPLAQSDASSDIRDHDNRVMNLQT